MKNLLEIRKSLEKQYSDNRASYEAGSMGYDAYRSNERRIERKFAKAL